jgi:hypothetical protein
VRSVANLMGSRVAPHNPKVAGRHGGDSRDQESKRYADRCAGDHRHSDARPGLRAGHSIVGGCESHDGCDRSRRHAASPPAQSSPGCRPQLDLSSIGAVPLDRTWGAVVEPAGRLSRRGCGSAVSRDARATWMTTRSSWVTTCHNVFLSFLLTYLPGRQLPCSSVVSFARSIPPGRSP